MIAVFLHIWRVTMLQCYNVTLFAKDFNNSSTYPKEFSIFLKKLCIFIKKSEGAFCNTPSLAYQYNEITLLNLTMNLVSFHINGAERTGWTKIFTSSTTDTSFCIDYWNLR